MKLIFSSSLSLIIGIAIVIAGIAVSNLFITPAYASIINLPKFDCINSSSGSNTDCGNIPNIKPEVEKIVASRSFSGSDIAGILKATGSLAINLFLVVINTVAGVLKGILPFLK